jgi:Tfp pilus assembly protein PilN
LKSRYKKIIAANEKKLHSARLDFLVRVIPALICARSVQYHKIAAEMTGDALESSKERRIRNFMNDYELHYDVVAYLD